MDAYRVGREWKRYEGTPQRDLFRELRVRFLVRHRPLRSGWSLEIGSGPGRFSPYIGARGSSRVHLDLSLEMLLSAREKLARVPLYDGAFHFVRGDGARAPFHSSSFAQVVALGNPVGFAEDHAVALLASASRLVSPSGLLVLETVAGPGEVSRYLRRLPPGAVGRLFSAPVRAVMPRVDLEGFEPLSERRGVTKPFRRMVEEEAKTILGREGLEIVDSMAVAPALGHNAERVSAIWPHEAAWRHLLEFEETIGRQPQHRNRAAALLIAAQRRETP